MKQKRHVCIVCKSKKVTSKMFKYRQHWSCIGCLHLATLDGASENNPAAEAAGPAADRGDKKTRLNVLNLYAGLGGNRKKWPAGLQVTAVENNPKIAAAYKEMYPNDIVVIGDAHQYLLKNYQKFDVIWSSPPCQTHSRMNYLYKNKYPDLSLYQEIILLSSFSRGLYVIENVVPYYDCLIKPDYTLSRHNFWCNFVLTGVPEKQLPEHSFNRHTPEQKRLIMDWLGIHYDKNIYLSSKNSLQVFRNCVHPDIGEAIFNCAIKSLGHEKGG